MTIFPERVSRIAYYIAKWCLAGLGLGDWLLSVLATLAAAADPHTAALHSSGARVLSKTCSAHPASGTGPGPFSLYPYFYTLTDW